MPVKYNVAQLLKSPAGATREYELDEDITGIDASLDVVSPLGGKVRFVRTGNGILVTGRLRTEVRVPCRRCLQPTPVNVTLQLEEEFHPSIDLITGAVVKPEPGEDEATRTDARHMLDLTEVVRQNLLLTLPLAPLCNSGCKGFCPECGANLNEGPCGCSHESDDPRLAALRELL
jgi:uncharacterized protein